MQNAMYENERLQHTVNVGVQTLSTGAPNIEFIGTAAISGGNIVSVAITNPGTGYTSTNPPVKFPGRSGVKVLNTNILSITFEGIKSI